MFENPYLGILIMSAFVALVAGMLLAIELRRLRSARLKAGGAETVIVTVLVLSLVGAGIGVIGMMLHPGPGPTPTPAITPGQPIATATPTPGLTAEKIAFTEYPIQTPYAGVGSITLGPDGSLWFIEDNAAKVGRVTVQGRISEFSLSPGSIPSVIVSGPDHNLWILENGNIRKIARRHPKALSKSF